VRRGGGKGFIPPAGESAFGRRLVSERKVGVRISFCDMSVGGNLDGGNRRNEIAMM
jgi:hypothetical protein